MNDLLGKVVCGLERCTRGNGICQGVHCPYHKGRDETIFCRMNLVSDVCSLLQIDANAPRVLTLEEVKDSIGEAIYFESRGTYMGKIVFPILPALFTQHGLMRYVHPQSSHYSELGLHDYGKVWRCWNARPTDEQRKKVKWDADVANQKEMV